MGPAALATPAAPVSAADAQPVDGREFAALLDALGPFEARPALAAAVSGGADSLALALLAQDWVRRRGGTLTALIVDHGLRPESAEEAATVARGLEARGVSVFVLRWDGAKPTHGVQQAAREARYRLLFDWCRTHHVLHLLLGHQRDDQIETVALRRARSSGPDGLAGMAAIVEHPDCRVLRPLLGVAGARLRATLQAFGQAWIEDPSNRNPAFARVRIRAALAGQPVSPPTAAGGARVAAERATAALLARSVAIYPEGWAVLDPGPWRAAGLDLARRALTRAVLAIGGGAYAPRAERIAAVLDAVLSDQLGGGRTLGGCRLMRRGQCVLICRESGRVGAAVLALQRLEWDGCFVVRWSGREPPGTRLGALGESGWREILAAQPEIREMAPPFPVPTALPALFDLEGVRAVPHLMYGRRGADPDSLRGVSAMFRPRHALAGPGFALS